MRNHPGAFVAGSLVANVLLLASSAGAAERLVVRTYDTVGLAVIEKTSARDALEEILRDAGLQLLWRDCPPGGCTDPRGSSELVVRIVSAPKRAASGSLGFAVVDIEQRTGTLATVYADRIKSIARRTGGNAGRLIGRAMAHEIGHLLLGTSQHSASGLMRAHWSDREVRRNLEPDWALAPQDIAMLRRGQVALAETGSWNDLKRSSTN
jgi:hypothetical protein